MSEWRDVRLADVGDIRPSNVDKLSIRGERPVRLCNYLDVYTRDYITEDIPFMEATASDAEIRRFGVERGDVLLTKDSETPDDIGVPAVVLHEVADLVAGYHLALVKPKRDVVDPVYLAKQLASDATARYFGRRANGSTRYGLTYDSLAQTPVRLAPPEQQGRIADMLMAVDRAIETTQSLIVKTQQIEAGLMHDLFTRGVLPDDTSRPHCASAPGQYTQSSLGVIPRDWQAMRLDSCLRGIDAGNSPECPERPPVGEEWGVLKVGAVHPTGLQHNQTKVVVDRTLHDPSLLVRDDDLLISRANTVDLVGLVCHVTTSPTRLMLSDKTLRLKVDSTCADVRFVFWALQNPTSRRQIEIAATGTSGGMKNIGQRAIRSLWVCRPDLDEQRRISDRLDACASREGTLRSSLSKFREIRSGLMSDLLTGAIRIPVHGEETAVSSV